MKVFREMPEMEILKESVIAIGSFDGVHLGHMELFEQLLKKKKERKLKAVVITFFPNPKALILKNKFTGHISSKDEKLKLLKSCNIDLLYSLNFNEHLRRISASSFLDQIVRAFNPSCFIVGYNHFFGYRKEGDLEFLMNEREVHSFEVIKVLEKTHPDQGKISSSKIRDFLLKGNIKEANALLGYNYSIGGEVVKGDELGRKIDFPTANLKIEKREKLLPRRGVYMVRSYIDGKSFLGMCNIGVRPTVSNAGKISIEVHFFDLSFEMYGKKIIIEFLTFIRNEIFFKDLRSLKKQLESDKNKCLEYSINNV